VSATHTLIMNVTIASAVMSAIGWSLVFAGLWFSTRERVVKLFEGDNQATIYLDEVLGLSGLVLALASSIAFVSTTVLTVINNA